MTQFPQRRDDGARVPPDNTDALFVPLLQDSSTYAGAALGTGPQPWRPGSLFYAAFFGGPVAATILAVLNARRYGERTASLLLLALGAAAFAALVIAAGVGAVSGSPRIAVIANGIVVYAAQLWLLRSADRVHQLRGGPYASLWGPGFAVVVVSALVTAGVLYAVGGAS